MKLIKKKRGKRLTENPTRIKYKRKQTAYNEANKEKIKEQKRIWYEDNKERLDKSDIDMRTTIYKQYPNQNITITTLRSDTKPTIRIL